MTANWRLGAVFALATLFLLLNASVVGSMVNLWDNSAYQHCYLIPWISLFLLWERRHTTLVTEWNGSVWGLIALACSIVVLIAATETQIQVMQHFAVLSGLVSFIWSLVGDRALRENWFPLAFLILCLPVGDTLIPILQQITVDLCTLALSSFGITSYREGMLILLPAGTFEVARACSGFRYLNAGIALGALFAYFYFRKPSSMICYVAFVILTFILMNGCRAFLTILIAASTEMRYMTGEDHIVLGYVLFLFAAIFVQQVAARFGKLNA